MSKFLQVISFIYLSFVAVSAIASVTPTIDPKTLAASFAVECGVDFPVFTNIYIAGSLNQNEVDSFNVSSITQKLNGSLSHVAPDWTFFLTNTASPLTVSGLKNAGQTYYGIAYCFNKTDNKTSNGLKFNWAQTDNKGAPYKLTVVYNDSLSVVNQNSQAKFFADYFQANATFVFDQNGNSATENSSKNTNSYHDNSNKAHTYFARDYALAIDSVAANITNSLGVPATVKDIQNRLNKLFNTNLTVQSINGAVLPAPVAPSFKVVSTVDSSNSLSLTLTDFSNAGRLAIVGDFNPLNKYTNADHIFFGLTDDGHNYAPFYQNLFTNGANVAITINLGALPLSAWQYNYNISIAASSEGSPYEALYSSVTSASFMTALNVASVVPSLDLVSRNVTVTVDCTKTPDYVWVFGGLNATDSAYNNQNATDIQKALGSSSVFVDRTNWRFYGVAKGVDLVTKVKINGIKNSNEVYAVSAICSFGTVISNSLQSSINWTQPDNGGAEFALTLTYNDTLNSTIQARELARFLNITDNDVAFDEDGKPAIIVPPAMIFLAERRRRFLSVVKDAKSFNYSTYFARDYSLANDTLNATVSGYLTPEKINSTIDAINNFLQIPTKIVGITRRKIEYVVPVIDETNKKISQDKFTFNIENVVVNNTNARIAWVSYPITNGTYRNFTAQGIFENKDVNGSSASYSGSSFYQVNVSSILTFTVPNDTNSNQAYAIQIAALGEGIPSEAKYSALTNMTTQFTNFGYKLVAGLGAFMLIALSLLN